jgi:hypothetical protein
VPLTTAKRRQKYLIRFVKIQQFAPLLMIELALRPNHLAGAFERLLFAFF